MISPCKGCADRIAGCHSECLKYKEWRADYDERKAVILKNKHEAHRAAEQYYSRYEIQKKENAIKRTERSKNGRG